MNETRTPKQFRVEGEIGWGDECPQQWRSRTGNHRTLGRGDGEGHPPAVHSRVQAEDPAGGGGVRPTGRDRSPAPPGGVVLLEPADLARAAAAGRRTGLGPKEAGPGAQTEEPPGR